MAASWMVRHNRKHGEQKNLSRRIKYATDAAYRAKMAQRRADWNAANSEKIAEMKRARRLANPEKTRQKERTMRRKKALSPEFQVQRAAEQKKYREKRKLREAEALKNLTESQSGVSKK